MHCETPRRHHIHEICILRFPWRWLQIGPGFFELSQHRRCVSVGLGLVSCLGTVEGVCYCVEVHVVGLRCSFVFDQRFVVEMMKRFEQHLVYRGLIPLRRICSDMFIFFPSVEVVLKHLRSGVVCKLVLLH